MKVLYVGVFQQVHAFDNYRFNGFRKAGFDVRKIDFRNVYHKEGAAALTYKISLEANLFQPDVIFINKGELLSKNAFDMIRTCTDAPIVLFYGDKRSEIPKWLQIVIPHYDAILINSDNDEDEWRQYRKAGAKKIFYHHTATDSDFFRKSNDEEIYDVLFFGSNYGGTFPLSKMRETYISKFMDSTRLTFKIYGHGWPYYGQGGMVYGQQFVQEASKAKIILGFQAFDNFNKYTSNRTFNCMACGFYLTQRWKGCDDMFDDRIHLKYFIGYEDMVDNIKYYLGHNDERKKIFKVGRKRIIRRHTYKVRANQLQDIVEELNGVNGKANTIIQAQTTMV